MKPTLIIMAAGMASRYGSLKQIEKLGPQGQTIMDYSVYDAIRAGFGKILFIIRKNIEAEFVDQVISKYKNKIEVDYVFQEMDKLPAGVTYATDRTKPWGTGHAVLMAAEKIDGPFAVINSDDFYGRNAFLTAIEHLNKNQESEEYAIIGYPINKTLSEFGAVSRAVCNTNSEQYLTDITERTHVKAIANDICYMDSAEQWHPMESNCAVSMNFWVFHPSFFNHLSNEFNDFIKINSFHPKAEIYIPEVVKLLIKKNLVKVKVYNVDSQWFGITYPDDKAEVMAKLQELNDYQ